MYCTIGVVHGRFTVLAGVFFLRKNKDLFSKFKNLANVLMKNNPDVARRYEKCLFFCLSVNEPEVIMVLLLYIDLTICFIVYFFYICFFSVMAFLEVGKMTNFFFQNACNSVDYSVH